MTAPVNFYRGGGALAASVCMLLAAARPAAADPESSDGAHLQEVVVTAQRRTENLDKVPIAATALSGSQLQERGVHSIDDLQFQAPALSVQQEGFLEFVNIRGVGLQAVNASTSSGVAFYTDGFFIPHETAIGEAYLDLQRIEVLRGPQGTLVGQNSTGGAILLVTKRPQLDRVTGYLEQTIGSYENYRTEGAVNVPLSGTVAVRAAASQESRDSFYNVLAPPGSIIPTSPNQPGNLRSHAARLQLLYEPSESFQLVLRQDFETHATDGTPARAYSELLSPSSPALAQPWTLQYNVPTKDDYSLQRTTLNVDWQITHGTKLRSVSGYQHEDSHLLYDLDYSAIPSSSGQHHFSENTLEQEIDLLSTGERRLNWVAGVFYLRDSLPVQYDYRFNSPPSDRIENDAPVHTSYSAFGQITYDITQHWQFVAGARVSHDIVQSSGYMRNIPGGVASLDLRETSTEPTGKVALNWLVTSHTTAYVSVSKGYKPGGLNVVGNIPTFSPETLVAYEAGLKSTLAQDHLRVTSAVFDYDDRGFQLSVFNPVNSSSAIVNAGNARIYGAELALDARVAGLGANISASYTHSSVGSLSLEDPRSRKLGIQDLSGKPVDYAPEWTATGGLEYGVEIGSGSLTPRVQYSYTGEQYASVFELAPYDIIRAHGQVDAKLTYQSGGRWWAELYGTNICNKLYVDGIERGVAAIWGAPRQYGIRGGLTF